MTYHQDVQDKIAAEISKLTRDPRGVTWADKVNLPYTEAVIMEVMRIEPTVTTSVAHATSKEVIFRGFRIPPSAHVYANFRAAHKDPSRFEDPDSFKPERFLNSDGQVTMPDAWMAFGSGEYFHQYWPTGANRYKRGTHTLKQSKLQMITAICPFM